MVSLLKQMLNSSKYGNDKTNSRPSLPNPFVNKSDINQTISDAITNAISSASVSFGGYLQIKCIFGMNLADYHCNSVPFGG